VVVPPSGDASGPWNKIAEGRKLATSGSALYNYFRGFNPGVQAWYNRFIGVDPADKDHVYLGLEEVFETTNGGSNWFAIGPYWNFGLPCSANGLDSCPKTTHPDQHAVAIANGTVYVGNDGGVWKRSTSIHTVEGWTDLNATLRTLQYYYAGAGRVPGGTGDGVWGGLQDNGASLILPGAATMVSPFGGDGGDVIVDPTSYERAVNEYVDLDMFLTTNAGRSDATTAIAVKGGVTYAAWCGPSGCNPRASSTTGEGFRRGIATNYGGTWHELDVTSLPNRYVYSLTVDPANQATVYAVFGGFSRRWIPAGGVGHVFKSTNGGASWSDITGNLPDAPGDDLVLKGSTMYVATDVGVFTAPLG